jgi:hypothetical protein
VSVVTPQAKPAPHYEFMGPPGALGTMVFLPILVVGLPIICNTQACPVLSLEALQASLPSWQDLFRADAYYVTLAWFALHALLYVVVPGPVFDGTAIKQLNGAKLKYTCNGACAHVHVDALGRSRQLSGNLALIVFRASSSVQVFETAASSPPWSLSCTSSSSRYHGCTTTSCNLQWLRCRGPLCCPSSCT